MSREKDTLKIDQKLASTDDICSSTAIIEQIENALASGRKIEAIKIYREATGTGLKVAKDFIDSLISKSIQLRQGEGGIGNEVISKPTENNDLIQIGQAQAYYNVSGTRILKYAVEIYHKGLNEHKIISAPEFYILEKKPIYKLRNGPKDGYVFN